MTEWERDLTEEGIEPNPGPMIISKNIDGISTTERFSKAMYEIEKEHRKDPLLAVLLQEHHITKEKARELREVAARHAASWMRSERAYRAWSHDQPLGASSGGPKCTNSHAKHAIFSLGWLRS